jgi:hypothetical protein
MRFTTRFYRLDLNLEAYKRDLLQYLRKLNKRAGQAWLDAVINKTPIPTWSGASRATFQKLASDLGTTVPIGPIRSRKNRTALGRSTSTGSGVVESKDFVGFVYETDLRYLAYNEYNHATKGAPPRPFSNKVRFTPYNFLGTGYLAWIKVAEKADIPDPYKFITKRKL